MRSGFLALKRWPLRKLLIEPAQLRAHGRGRVGCFPSVELRRDRPVQRAAADVIEHARGGFRRGPHQGFRLQNIPGDPDRGAENFAPARGGLHGRLGTSFPTGGNEIQIRCVVEFVQPDPVEDVDPKIVSGDVGLSDKRERDPFAREFVSQPVAARSGQQHMKGRTRITKPLQNGNQELRRLLDLRGTEIRPLGVAVKICDHIRVFGNAELAAKRQLFGDRKEEPGVDRVRNVFGREPELPELVEGLARTRDPEIDLSLADGKLRLLQIEKRRVVRVGNDEAPLENRRGHHAQILPERRVDHIGRYGIGFPHGSGQRGTNLAEVFIQRPPHPVAGCVMNIKHQG